MRFRKLSLYLLVLFAAFSLTACGGGDDDPTNTSGTVVIPGGGGSPGGGSGTWPAGVLQAGSDSTDYAIGMVKDNDGNIYVTGYSSGNLDPATCTIAGLQDIYLVKYNSSGVKQWTKMLGSDNTDQVFAIAYDGNDGIYLTGYTAGILDGNANPSTEEIMFIVKFSTGGSKQWTKVYETAGSHGRGIACHSGHIFVTGDAKNGGISKLFVAEYNDVGVEVWKNYYADGYNGQSIALDTSGNIYVTASGTTLTLYKFNSTGVEQWSRPRADLYLGKGIVLDSGSNIYFTGTTKDPFVSHSYIVKYDTSGNVVWENAIASSEPDGGNEVALDSLGNVYVTGGTRGNLNGEINAKADGTTYDMFLIKYNSAGTRQWTKLLGTAAYDAGVSLVMLNDSYILVYGHTYGVLGSSSPGGPDYFLASFDSSGVLQ